MYIIYSRVYADWEPPPTSDHAKKEVDKEAAITPNSEDRKGWKKTVAHL